MNTIFSQVACLIDALTVLYNFPLQYCEMKSASFYHLLAAATLLPCSLASPAAEEIVEVKMFNEDIMQQHHAIGDFQVLDAFKKQGRANPTETFDDDGESMLLYTFDTAD